MRPHKLRFVTACQQMLVLGAVVAVLAPAANVISLDVTTQPPAAGEGELIESDLASGDQEGGPEAAEVETAPVEPEVAEYAIDAETTETALEAAPELADSPLPDAAVEALKTRATGDEAVSDTEVVDGYTAVGVTWDAAEQIADDEISVMVRTRTDDEWSEWTAVDYHDEHGPDPDSEEAKNARPGTDPLLVGEVEAVQAKAVTVEGVSLPSDMKLALVAPGASKGTEIEQPELDTASPNVSEAPSSTPSDPASDVPSDAPSDAPSDQQETPAGESHAPDTLTTDQGEIALQATKVTTKPKIYSRAQWGANEKLRDKSSLQYHEVHAGFVHHTVNGNDYTRDQVPGIIRSIYAYHTQSRGWSDVGYNFLVDKFGRIWEGRYGGVDRPVVGAHTLGYNEYSFAMSAIGNFDKARPSSSMVEAYARLFAWKLSLHGVNANSSRQTVGNSTFRAINGHRDAGQTACPGRYLYDQIDSIRSKARAKQVSWDGRNLQTNLVGSSAPDFLVRRDNGTGYVIPTGGTKGGLGARTPVTTGWNIYDTVRMTPDVTGDGIDDVVVRSSWSGRYGVRAGLGNGRFDTNHISLSTQMRGFDQITAVGNLNGATRPDLVARDPRTGYLYLYRGASAAGTFAPRLLLSKDWGRYTMTAATGDTTGDGIPDLYARDKNGVLWLVPGAGGNKIKAPVKVMTNTARFDVITGYGDITGDGKADLAVRTAASDNLYVYSGKGDGTFGTRLGPLLEAAPLNSFSFGDTDKNGLPDLVGIHSRSMLIYENRPGGNGNTGTPVSVGDKFENANLLLNAGDWDRDGHGDIIIRETSGALKLIRGLGDDKFASATTLASSFKYHKLISAPGDVTGDGYPDLMAQPSGGAMRIYPGNGRTFKSSFVAKGAISASAQLGIGRWDSDGAPDSLFRNGTKVTTYRGNGPGGLTGSARSVTSPSLSGYNWFISAGDLNGDGRQDLLVRRSTTGDLYLMPGTSSGFGWPKHFADGFAGYDLAG